jgi:hypothetical protein
LADALEQVRGVEGGTTRAVAAYIEHLLGAELAQRRAIVREASEQGLQVFGPEFDGSVVRDKLPSSVDIPIGDTDLAASRSPSIPTRVETGSASLPLAQPPATAEVIEHRSIRGLLAAAMLILVGSAIGLLLARSSASTKEVADEAGRRSAPSSATAEGVQHPEVATQLVRPPATSASSIVPALSPTKR